MKDGKDFQLLKDYVIRNFGYDGNISRSFAICDSMISHLVEGELDGVLPSFSLFSVSEDERKRVLGLAHQYQELCFYDGDASNWEDSVEDISKISEDVSAFRIFQNFEFLIQLAKEGGEPLLEQLSKFQECEGFSDSSVVEYLRRTFGNDSLLKGILLSMTAKDSMYSIFTDQQKADLLTYPEGTVYFYGEGGPRLTHPLLLSLEIYSRMNGKSSVDIPRNHIDKMALELQEFFQKDVDFSEVVRDMSDDYHEIVRKNSNRPAGNVVELYHDMKGDIPHVGWTIDDNPLVQMLETPYHPVSNSEEKSRNR